MNPEAKKLLQKIETKKARVGVVGLGYVGVPLVKTFLQKGFRVTGFDIDRKKVDMLNRGKSYIRHISAGRAQGLPEGEESSRRPRTSGASATSTPSSSASRRRSTATASPTSPTSSTRPSPSPSTCGAGQLVVLESTTYPGTTDEEMLPILEAGGLQRRPGLLPGLLARARGPGQQELLDGHDAQGRRRPDARTASRLATALYGQIIVRTVPVSSTKVAEVDEAPREHLPLASTSPWSTS